MVELTTREMAERGMRNAMQPALNEKRELTAWEHRKLLIHGLAFRFAAEEEGLSVREAEAAFREFAESFLTGGDLEE